MKTLLLVLALLAPLHAAVRTEIGEINGAKFRIDVPEKWNGGLTGCILPWLQRQSGNL
jgi:hypothetical protein